MRGSHIGEMTMKFFAAIAAAAFVAIMPNLATADNTVRDGYNYLREAQCTDSDRAGDAFGTFGGLTKAAPVISILVFAAGQPCYEFRSAQNWNNYYKWRREHPRLARKLDQHMSGGSVSYSSSYVTTSSSVSRCSGWPAGMLPANC